MPSPDDAAQPNGQLGSHDTTQVEALAEEVAELRDGHHELLRMYEALRDGMPKRCLCAAIRERAVADVAALDVLAPDASHEDYRPK